MNKDKLETPPSKRNGILKKQGLDLLTSDHKQNDNIREISIFFNRMIRLYKNSWPYHIRGMVTTRISKGSLRYKPTGKQDITPHPLRKQKLRPAAGTRHEYV
jgi:hypothetical protein